MIEYVRNVPGVEFQSPDSEALKTWLEGKKNIVAGTGHRPNKLPPRAQTVLRDTPVRGDYDKFGLHTKEGWALAASVARDYLTKLAPDGVIAGGAIGWDMLVAAAAWNLGLPICMAIPFETQDSRWPDPKKPHGVAARTWALQLQRANIVVVVTPTSQLIPAGQNVPDEKLVNRAMDDRNQFMVDYADHILAFHNGTRGGTANCLDACEKAGMTVENGKVTNAWKGFLDVVLLKEEYDPFANF